MVYVLHVQGLTLKMKPSPVFSVVTKFTTAATSQEKTNDPSAKLPGKNVAHLPTIGGFVTTAHKYHLKIYSRPYLHTQRRKYHSCYRRNKPMLIIRLLLPLL